MSHYKPYPAYKDSGVEWLGRVPEHWAACRFSRVIAGIKDGTHGTFERVDSGQPLLSAKNVADGLLDISSTESQISDLDHMSIVANGYPQRGDLLLTIVGTLGRSCVYMFDQPLSFQRSVCFIRLLGKFSPEFFRYFTQSKFFQEQIHSKSKSSAQAGIYMGDVSATSIAFPVSREEQQAVVAHLDRETARIDALVAKKTRFIELLREKRQALITYAVTKGLDPNVKMKESGVEWLGEVPEHWVLNRLRHVSPEITVGIVVEPSKYYCEVGVPALRSLNVKPGSICPENLVFITEEANRTLSKSRLRAGDLVAVRSGQAGTTAVIPPELDGCNCIDLIIIRKPLFGNERYLSWYLGSDPAKHQFSEGSGGSIQQHFNIGAAQDLLLPFPPENEQAGIAEFLNEHTCRIDALVGKTELSIDLLKERRSALITAAVTGQIDLRETV